MAFDNFAYTVSRLGLMLARVQLEEDDSPDVAILKDHIRALLLRKQDVDEIEKNVHAAGPAKITMVLLAQCGTSAHVREIYHAIDVGIPNESVLGMIAIHFARCNSCLRSTLEQLRPHF